MVLRTSQTNWTPLQTLADLASFSFRHLALKSPNIYSYVSRIPMLLSVITAARADVQVQLPGKQQVRSRTEVVMDRLEQQTILAAVGVLLPPLPTLASLCLTDCMYMFTRGNRLALERCAYHHHRMRTSVH